MIRDIGLWIENKFWYMADDVVFQFLWEIKENADMGNEGIQW